MSHRRDRSAPCRALAALMAALMLAACSDGGDPPPPPAEGSATVSASGGTVQGPDGVRLEVPSNALDSSVTFRIARDASGAPPLVGINAVSPVYAVTPHGQAFGASALLSIPLSAADIPAGATPVLLKAEPGGPWRVVPNASTDPLRMAADVGDLSYFVVGVCSSATGGTGFIIGAASCPSNHELRMTLFDGQNQPVQVLRGPNGVQLPLWYVTDTVQTRTFTVSWTRPPGTTRTDSVSILGLGNTVVTPRPSAVQDVSSNFSTTFTMTVDPASISGANRANGQLLRPRAQAAYTTTAFLVGTGNVPTGFVFEVDIPILVRFTGPLPMIVQQPSNLGVTEGQSATFTVQADITPAGALTYQWSRRANTSAAFAPISGATAASFNLATTALSDDGAQFQVAVCAASTRCITSNPTSLSVTQLAVAPSFTQNPSDLSVAAGQTASFSATATGLPLPQLRWQSQQSNGSFADVAGVASCAVTTPPATGISVSATCTLGPVSVVENGLRLRAVASNTAAPGGIFSGTAALTVNAAPQAPVITQQPAAQTTTVGGSASFSVVATGTATLAYVWQQGGTNLPSVSGGFNAGNCQGDVTYSSDRTTITLSNLTAGCNGVSVGVTVSNGVNPSAVSTGATLTVNPAPASGVCFAGQSGWCYANPSPQADSLTALVYSGSTFTAVGTAGTTLRTTDSGATWQLAFETGRTYFTDLASPAPGVLVAAGLPRTSGAQGSGGFTSTGVFISTDGGQTWTRRLDAGFPGQFAVTKLAFANASVGVAAGPQGLWRTTDGGLTWSALNSGQSASILASTDGGVTWANTSVVLVYGSAGKILRSDDQGVTWTDVSPAGFADNWNDMAFNADGVGIAVGPNGKVARSTNGGASWQEVNVPSSEPGTAVAFADRFNVVVMGNTFDTLRSADAGLTWTLGSTFGASSFYRLRFASPRVGLAVSAIGGLTLRTVDGGESWTRIGGGTIDENVNGMAASPSGNVVLAGSIGRDLLRSTNGGATWTRPGFTLVGAQFQRPSFATEQRVIAIRPAGRIALSVDAGQTWSIVYDRLGQVSLSNTTMASATLGFVVGDNGLILRTSDGGSSWTSVSSGTTLPLKSVACLTATVCLVGGFDGALLRSVDAGATWSVARVPITAGGSQVRTIARITDSIVVLAIDDGLWRSTDAGLTWTRVFTPTSGSLIGVSFNAAGIGIASGLDGILRSTNQGLNWAVQSVPVAAALHAVTWVTPTTVLVGGDSGLILRNQQSGAQ